MRIWYKTREGLEKAAKGWHKKGRDTVTYIDLTPKKYKQYILEVKPRKKRSKK